MELFFLVGHMYFDSATRLVSGSTGRIPFKLGCVFLNNLTLLGSLGVFLGPSSNHNPNLVFLLRFWFKVS